MASDLVKLIWKTDAFKAFNKYREWVKEDVRHYPVCDGCLARDDWERVFSEDGSTFEEIIKPAIHIGEVTFYIKSLDSFAWGCTCKQCAKHYYLVYDESDKDLYEFYDEIDQSDIYTSKCGFWISLKDKETIEHIAQVRQKREGKLKLKPLTDLFLDLGPDSGW